MEPVWVSVLVTTRSPHQGAASVASKLNTTVMFQKLEPTHSDLYPCSKHRNVRRVPRVPTHLL